MDGRALADPPAGQLPNLILQWGRERLEKRRGQEGLLSVCGVREENLPG
jgi:hypothetical protein